MIGYQGGGVKWCGGNQFFLKRGSAGLSRKEWISARMCDHSWLVVRSLLGLYISKAIACVYIYIYIYIANQRT